MKRYRSAALIGAVMILSYLAGSRLGRPRIPESGPAGQVILPAGEAGGDTADADVAGAVRVSKDALPALGIRVGAAEARPVVHTLRLLGRVAADEVRTYRIVASVDGWIESSYDNSVGTYVKKGDVLATFYSPQFLDAEQAFIYALDAVERLQTGRRLELGRQDLPAQSALDQLTVLRQVDILRSLGMSDAQIEEIGEKRLITQAVRIVSPAGGFVTARNVSPGQRFMKGTELFQIVDLSRIWVMADVFEREARFFVPGSKARITTPYQQRGYTATVADVLPVFDPETRTLKVRLVADNPGFLLKPDMFADVELAVDLGTVLTVPAEAVLFSGRRATVFVERGPGTFEQRRIRTGWRLGDRLEVVGGLAAGERIALSGNFFLDSESRLQAAAQGDYGDAATDPVCGTDVDEARAGAAGLTSVYKGETYYFCSPECMERFDRDPGAYGDRRPGAGEASERKDGAGAGND